MATSMQSFEPLDFRLLKKQVDLPNGLKYLRNQEKLGWSVIYPPGLQHFRKQGQRMP